MIVAVIVLAVVLAAVLATLIPVVAYQQRRLRRVPGPAPELEQALVRERRRADIAEAELKVVRNRISSLESQLELPQGESS
jgi:hypothetical protein